jgi:hypothetical protein
MTRARNDRKPRVLMDLPTNNIGMIILATETIVIIAYPNKGPKSSSMTRER